MVLDPHRWLELCRFRGLYESGAMSLREIAKETGLNRRMVAKYPSGEVPAALPQPEPNGRQRPVDEAAALIDAMLRAAILLKGTVIHEPLVQKDGAAINDQRVKLYLQARPRIGRAALTAFLRIPCRIYCEHPAGSHRWRSNGVASSTPPTTRSCGAPGPAASSPAVTANPTARSLR